MRNLKANVVLLLFVSLAVAQDRPKKFEQVKWFLPSTGQVGQWGEIPARQGMVKFTISEVTGKNEAILIEEKRTLDRSGGVEIARTKFILVGRKTDEMISGREYEMVGDFFRAIGTRKLGKQTVIVIEPHSSK